MRFKTFSVDFLCLLLILSLGAQQNWRTCVRVLDGDTIVLDGNEKVRLIGVDTPKTKDPRKPVQYFGKEAYEFTKGLVEGKKVRLEYDQTRIDKYGSTLAYVYLEDGAFLNAELIKQGYGFAYTKYPFKYLEEFRQYERQARENERGLWIAREREEPNLVDEWTIVYFTPTGSKYHRKDCKYLGSYYTGFILRWALEKDYTPCSFCNPGEIEVEKPKVEEAKPAEKKARIAEEEKKLGVSEDTIVYITRTGKKYHTGGCSYLRKSKIPISLKDACARGYTPCSRCSPPRCK